MAEDEIKTEDNFEDPEDDEDAEDEEFEGSGADSADEREEVSLEDVAQFASEVTARLLSYFPRIEEPRISWRVDEGSVWVEVEGDPTGRLIGRKGQTIDAFEHVISKMVSHKFRRRVNVNVDAEGYKKRMREKLVDLATKTADYVASTGGARALEPMSPADRRIIHITLRQREDVITASEGREPNRFVVIWPNDEE